jgi:thioredoxin reductase
MVIGDANSALQYAILLAAQCPHVDVVTLFDKFFADESSSKA